MNITVRDDDVLFPTNSHSDPSSRFIKVHSIIASSGAHHVPAIVCNPIQQYPEIIEFIKQEMDKGTMTPQLHGWDHVDYAIFSPYELELNFEQCLEWFNSTLGIVPSIFYTPWGGNSTEIEQAANNFGMELIDCSSVVSPRNVERNIRIYNNHTDIELFIHWWEGVGRLENALRLLNEL